MLLAPDIQVYLKTTETCNLNCSHCFTSGSKGAKIFFDPKKSASFLTEITKSQGVRSTRIIFHGGEPLLAPLSSLYEFYELTYQSINEIEYGIQTNLVYRLDTKKMDFFKNVIGEHGIGTSWDADLRFSSLGSERTSSLLRLWEENVRTLVQEGHKLTLMVSLSRELITTYTPAQILDYAIDLGISYVLFERITTNGNALDNRHILPANKDVDQWLLRMYQDTRDYRYHERIGNMFLEELANSVIRRSHVANRCRGCEQKIITLNADGTISGCPNSAASEYWGTIVDGPVTFLSSPKRLEAICREKMRNPVCLNCDVSDLCNGDCYKLKWDDDVCSAPKSIFRMVKSSPADQRFFEELFL